MATYHYEKRIAIFHSALGHSQSSYLIQHSPVFYILHSCPSSVFNLPPPHEVRIGAGGVSCSRLDASQVNGGVRASNVCNRSPPNRKRLSCQAMRAMVRRLLPTEADLCQIG